MDHAGYKDTVGGWEVKYFGKDIEVSMESTSFKAIKKSENSSGTQASTSTPKSEPYDLLTLKYTFNEPINGVQKIICLRTIKDNACVWEGKRIFSDPKSKTWSDISIGYTPKKKNGDKDISPVFEDPSLLAKLIKDEFGIDFPEESAYTELISK